jgi:hypothetical protein
LRRTAANSMQELGVLDSIIGHVLNHRSVTRATVTQKHYTPRIPQREMREALELWADRLTAPVCLGFCRSFTPPARTTKPFFTPGLVWV